jgi:hypothetical protein
VEFQRNYRYARHPARHARAASAQTCVPECMPLLNTRLGHRITAITGRAPQSQIPDMQHWRRTLIRSHKAALFSTRAFWKQLLHHDVSFTQLTKCFANIENNEVR